VDAADTSILGNQISTQMYKVLSPVIGATGAVTTAFHNEIVPGSVISTQFLLADGNTYVLTDYNPNINSFTRVQTSNGFTSYNSNPVMYLKQVTTNNTQNYLPSGNIDYTNGIISIKNLTVYDFLGNGGIQVYVSAVPDDIVGKFNDVVEIDLGQVAIEVLSA
jgi:hypothetical protein